MCVQFYKWPWCLMGQKLVFCCSFVFWVFAESEYVLTCDLFWVYVFLQAKWNRQYVFAFTADFVSWHLLLFKFE